VNINQVQQVLVGVYGYGGKKIQEVKFFSVECRAQWAVSVGCVYVETRVR